ncbi:DsrE/DsrF-like family protein [Desulfacinum hydrothermale DSM 13146]|uniref:DsrE/DsrF-like family protein n=1 Tax=Desulfacinum hydrothermale DSM 13146 TaxID=1121390 RepID=A0A1W1XAK8_9BACT|nr:DsrE family protein [Desulfacinum hydrothermale]SMC20728.1 DsrE/DsrF-like family protein [Desulfacinum hydrothermale DSM 13146]
MKKVALFSFNGEVMCFVHVLLNALDMQARGFQVTVVVEGASVQVIPELARGDHPMHDLYEQVKQQGLFAGVCRGCAAKLQVLQAVETEGLPLLADMSGHVSMGRYVEEGWQVITF